MIKNGLNTTGLSFIAYAIKQHNTLIFGNIFIHYALVLIYKNLKTDQVPQRIGFHNGSIQIFVTITSLNHLKYTNIVHDL